MINIRTVGVAAVGAAAIGLSVGSAAPAQAATLTQTFSSASSFGSSLFQQFDASLGTLQSVALGYNSSQTQNYRCVGSCTSSVAINLNLAFPGTSGLTFSSTAGPATFSAGPVSQTATTTGTYSFASLSQFIGNGRIGAYNNRPSPASISGNFDSRSISTSLSNHLSLTYTYDATPIPTPALLPGLLGLGVAALRKKRKSEQSQQVAEAIEV